MRSIQAAQLRGTVVDETGNPIFNATVMIQGTTEATTTDQQGKFSLETEQEAPVLIVSYVGYKTQTHLVTNAGGEILIRLEKMSEMEEVVVVGYGTQKKLNLTGAVSQISSEVLENRPAPNLTRMLQGTLPNLNLKMSDGSPTRRASYNVRGLTSIGAGGSALVLIDGVEGDPNLINPADVQSVSVLKDASSAAIYGSRAAFGVVLITTKDPAKGKATLDVRVSQSMNKRTVVPNLVTDGYQWAKNFDDAFYAWYDYKTHPITVNANFPFSLEYLERLKNHDPSQGDAVYNESLGRFEYFGSTDWFDLLHKDNMPATEASVTVSGGNDKAKYFVSGLYYHQDGIFRYSSDKFKKWNLRAKGEVNLNKWLTFENNTDMSTYKYAYPLLANGDAGIWRYYAVGGFPMATMFNPDGTFTQQGANTGASFIEGSSRSDQDKFFFRTTPALTAKPFGELLTFKANFTYAKTFNNDKRFNNYVYYSNKPGELSRFGNSQYRALTDNTTYWGSNITADLKKTFNEKHNLGVLLGYNIESNRLDNLDARRDGLLVPDKPDFNLLDGLNYGITGGGNEWKYLGLFYRVTYSFNDKYLLEFNGRYDGSSKFPENQRYGFFPSASAGWNISREEFMASTRGWLDNLKLRASYGSLGNGNVAPYRYMETMSVSKTSVILDGVQKPYTSIPGVIPNGLTWEKATTLDFGMDANMLKGKFNVTFDWYNRITTDMFTSGQPLPNVFGASVPYGNYADLKTVGWELTLGWKDQFDVGGSPLHYSISGSLWDNKSTILKFNNPNKLLSSYYEGMTVGDIWGYETLGFFSSDEEAANWADQTFLRNSNTNEYLAGDLKFADRNGDGVINQGENTLDNPGDRMIIGNNSPRYQYGANLSVNWKGVGISAFVQGIGKRDWYFAPEADLFYGPYNRPYGFQPVVMMDDYWTEDNPNAYWPRYRGYTALGTNRSLGAPQTRYLQSASYLRLKNVSIDYTLPQDWLARLGVKKALIYLSGQNILTFSGLYKHTDNFDPEVIEPPIGDMTNSHGEGDAYPMLKTYTLGINLSF
ncbi:TonB-dependent receptor [Niabella terrae]